MKNKEAPASTDERLDAIETLLQHLIFMIEAEPNFTAQALVEWIGLCRERERAHGIADARAQVVFSQLCERLQLVSGEQPQADSAAQQAALAAIQKSRHHPPAG